MATAKKKSVKKMTTKQMKKTKGGLALRTTSNTLLSSSKSLPLSKTLI
jgi:hypothetical protein